jgi:enoyl-CoA hydratase/carnithine racemase
MTDDIEVAREVAVMSAAFARPQKKIAITGLMYEKLIEAFEAAERDPDIGAFLLSGKGGVFTAGNDIADFLAVAARGRSDFPAWRFVSKLAEFEKPLIAAVDGLAIGVGTTFLFHCDLVYATPEARFQMPFVNLGLVPEAGSSLLAPQRFGRAKAANFCCLASPSAPMRRLSSASSTLSCLRASLWLTRCARRPRLRPSRGRLCSRRGASCAAITRR